MAGHGRPLLDSVLATAACAGAGGAAWAVHTPPTGW